MPVGTGQIRGYSPRPTTPRTGESQRPSMPGHAQIPRLCWRDMETYNCSARGPRRGIST